MSENRPDDASTLASPPGAATDARSGEPLLVVGIGAAAGDLDAVCELFSAMPGDSGMAFVLVQHFDPSQPSAVPERLSRATAMPVELARDGARVMPDHVYVAPPAMVLSMESGTLRVRPCQDLHERGSIIDLFFEGLAADQDERAVCIVLSGLGRDGTSGLKAVKEYGGLALAQTASTAWLGSMPASAARTGLLDEALPVQLMPQRLADYARHLQALHSREGTDTGEGSASGIEAHLLTIWRILRARTGQDFTRYKPAPMIRRIQRRMLVLGMSEASAYVDRLQIDPFEVDRLLDELLIGVTCFFRDPGAFQVLETRIIPKIFENRQYDEQIRVWVPGCATGEEAYSLAMLMREHLDRVDARPRLQIFATDIDRRALDEARRGQYAKTALKNVSRERLARFFHPGEQGQYQVGPDLREICLFSTHNLIQDPPFSRLDLLSCRNLLIYFHQETQHELVPLFHYALRPGGHLFLGPSEALGAHPELFECVDKKHRVFLRQEGVKRPSMPSLQLPIIHSYAAGDARTAAQSEPIMSKLVERTVLEEYSSPAVTINERFDIIYATGPTARYLSLPSGQPQLNLLQMVKRDLRLELYPVLHKAFNQDDTVEHEIRAVIDDEERRVRVVVRPLSRIGGQRGLYLVVFQDLGPALHPVAELEDQGDDSAVVRRLEADLLDTRQHLRTTVDKLEASNEELKSSNEELLSMNEELQSAIEELQTSKEELQSANEELETVNAEMSRKVEELNRAHSDLLNFFQSTHVPTLFLDRDLRIVRFTAAAREVFRLIDTDVGRPIGDITRRFIDADLENKCRQVLGTRERTAVEVSRPSDGASFIMRIALYRTVQDVIDGVVVTFADITQLKRAQEALLRSETRYRSLLETLTSVVFTTSAAGLIIEPQPSLAEYTGQPFDEPTSGAPPGWLGERYAGYRRDGWLDAVHPEDRQDIELCWLEALSTGKEFSAEGRIFHAASGTYRYFEARAVAIRNRGNVIEEWVGTLTDVHDRRTTELALRESQNRLDLAILATGLGIFEFDPRTRRTRSSESNRHILGLPVAEEPSYEDFLRSVHADDRERVDRAVWRALDPAGDGTYDVEYRVHGPDSKVHWISARARAQFEERDGERRPCRLVGTIQDITEKMRVQRELEQRAAQQAAVSELGIQALQQTDLQEVLDRAVAILVNTLQVPYCKVLEHLPGTDELFLRAGVGWKPGLVGHLRLSRETESQASVTLRAKQPVVVADLERNARFHGSPLLIEHGVVSGMSVIINGPDAEPWGVIGVYSDRPQEFTQDDVNFLQAIANILATTIARVRSEDALVEAKRSAEEANAAKDRFLAVLSHELRTPLTPVLAAASALESDTSLPDRVREVLRMVRRNVDLEARLLDDLLDLTRINQGKLKLEPQPVKARELLERTIGICAQEAANKELKLELYMKDQDCMLYVDPSRAMQILWNLLNNAIKYTPAGGRIEVRCAKASQHILRIEIEDTGVGMERELLARAFDPFEQGPPPETGEGRSPGQRGLGLGLAIVRALVEGHGGRVSVHSAGRNQGTTFRIELPLAPKEVADDWVFDKTGPLVLRHSGPVRVLLVEDHEDSADILATVLQGRGLAVTVAGSGREALSAVKKAPFDVVVSDIGLPDMPGYELFVSLRKEQPSLVGIAYSGYGMDSDVQRCLEAGFGEHLTKPVDIGKLERAIYRLISG